jgi:hypothetical protein
MNEFQTTNHKGQPNETWGSHDGNDEEHWLLGSDNISEKHTPACCKYLPYDMV